MNKAKRLTAFFLAALLCTMQLPVGVAEGTEALTNLMQGVRRPSSFALTVNPAPPEDAGIATKTVTVNFTSRDGESAQAVLELSFERFSDLDAGWQGRAQAYADLVRDSSAMVTSIDPEAFAGRLSQAVDSMHQYNENLARNEAAQGEDAAAPIPAAKLLSVSVTAPSYQALKRGSRGDDVMRLQQRLIELGFLDGDADGQFGPATEAGVKALQEHVRALEQEQIELLPAPTAPPAPTATPVPEGEQPNPDQTPAPAPTAPPRPDPATELNGVADAELQAYLYSDTFSIAGARLAEGSEGAPVRRLQNRLALLGYMVEAANGTYGPATARAVRTFQHYNGQSEDGIATRELQQLIYSPSAERPPYPMLSEGSRGDEVKALQQRLKLLGFMIGDVDGTYGKTTVQGVKNLQQYLWKQEEQKLLDAALAERDRLYPETPAVTPADAASATEAPIEAIPSAPGIVPEIPFESGDENTPVLETIGFSPMNAVRQAFVYLFGGTALAEEPEATPEPMPSPTPRPTPRPIDTSAIDIAVDGICDPMLQETFYSPSFPAIPGLMKKGAQGIEVQRLQRRLYDLEYLFINSDGDYGDITATAVTEFQSRNGLTADGDAGEQTISKLFSDSAKKALKPYLLKISISKQRVYAYAPDENEEYTRLVRTMKCSTGLPSTPTPKGTFQSGTGPAARWHYFKKFHVWAQYAYSIEGDILFHSVLFNSRGGRATSSSVYNLGSRASHGCVRLAVEDAKWVWSNCPRRTKIIVY